MADMGKSVLRGMLCSIAVILLICTVIGTAELFADISDTVLEILSVFVLGAAAYSAGYFATQLHRSQGFVQGILCGAGIFLIALLLSVMCKEFEFRDITLVKAAVCIISGIVGGIRGVNTKKTGLRH